jgi:hypothetical protein
MQANVSRGVMGTVFRLHRPRIHLIYRNHDLVIPWDAEYLLKRTNFTSEKPQIIRSLSPLPATLLSRVVRVCILYHPWKPMPYSFWARKLLANHLPFLTKGFYRYELPTCMAAGF